MRNHYDNLKVSQDAPIEVIQAAYRTLAKKYHPDLNPDNPDAEHIMQIINSAYEVLSDPLLRQEHDSWIAKQNLKNIVEKNKKEESSRDVNNENPLQKSVIPHSQPSHTLKRLKLVWIVMWVFISWFIKRATIISLLVFLYYFFIRNTNINNMTQSNTSPINTPKNSSIIKNFCAPTMKTFTDGSTWPANPKILSVRETKKGLSSLSLDNSQNKQNLLIKVSSLTDRFTTGFAWELFIPAGQQLVLKGMPKGEYVVKIKDTESGCAQISQIISMTEIRTPQGIEYSDNSLTFYPVINGNTHLDSLPNSQF